MKTLSKIGFAILFLAVLTACDPKPRTEVSGGQAKPDTAQVATDPADTAKVAADSTVAK